MTPNPMPQSCVLCSFFFFNASLQMDWDIMGMKQYEFETCSVV